MGDTLKEDYILQVQNCIRKNLKTNNYKIEEMIDYLLNNFGKMLRSRIFLEICGDNNINERQIKIAAAIEMVHLASLAHDDIIDDAKYRRGQLSIQSKFGKDVAVYTGDYILSRIFLMLSNFEVDKELKNFTKQIYQIFAGELMQFSFKFKSNISTKEYLRIIRGKTATIFSISAYLGAKEGELSLKDQMQYGIFGNCLGMAFQITDDILDFTGDFDNFGKQVYNDIVNGTYSLPILINLNKNKTKMLHWLEESNVEAINDSVISSGSIDECISIVKTYIKKAKRALNNTSNRDNDKLFEILDSIICRVK